MSLRAEKILLLTFLVLGLVFAYAGSFYGQPLWDDWYFIFQRYTSNLELSHGAFWRHHIWPFFDSLTFAFYGLARAEVLWWHLLNFSLHVLNSWLLYQLVKSWRPPWAFALAVLFAFHPLNALSVAWIIQLKTVLATCFVLLSILYWQRAAYAPSVLFYALSLVTKSLALPLPWLALVLLRRRVWNLKILPFLFLSLLSAWRIFHKDNVKDVITATTKTVYEQVKPAEEVPQLPQVKVAEPKVTQPLVVPDSGPVVIADSQPVPLVVTEEKVPLPATPEWQKKLGLMFYTTGHYLAMPWWPWPLLPVHQIYRGSMDVKVGLGWLLVLLSLIWGAKQKNWLPLKAMAWQLGLVFPVSGVLVLPYMSYTAISEQHLYATIPFALFLQLYVADQLVPKSARVLLLCWVVCLFAGLTANYTQSFKDERSFYARILEHDPDNALATLNLAGFYSAQGLNSQALKIVMHHIQKTDKRPALKDDPLYPFFIEAQLRYELNDLK
jgi:hypothetical protein